MQAHEIEAKGLKFFWDSASFTKVVPGKWSAKPSIYSKNVELRFVKLESGVHSGIHNHKKEKLQEWHYIISGTGWALLYNNNGKVSKKFRLKPGTMAPMFDSNTSNHEFAADNNEPLLYLAIIRRLKPKPL